MTSGLDARDVLVNALKQQQIVAGNAALAEAVADAGERIVVPAGTTIIHQGGDDNEVYLILGGSFHIVVNGRTIARRTATDHVGEMAAILPLKRRAASVVAYEDSVVVRLSDEQVAQLGDRFPQIWRSFARELAHRLEQRNTMATAVNENVRVFVMASASGGRAAQTIRNSLANDPFEVAVWSEGAFRGSGYTVDRLEGMLDQSDAAVAVVGHDDKASRDDIIFELGFFMGRLGRHRTFLVEPRAEKVALPQELAGINTITYRGGEDLEAALAPACDRLRKAIHEVGRNR